LRAALSTYTGVPAEQVICGAGADELIDMLLRLCVVPGDTIIDCPPTFGMYAFDAGICGAQVLTVPRRADFSLDLERIRQSALHSAAKILFLTSPNNPTGNLTPQAEIEQLLQLPVLVVVDEAYIEFAEPGGTPVGCRELLARYENLVILRTFSKWAGLAGLRVGYALVPDWLAHNLWKIKQPYNVSVAAEAAALASLADLPLLQANVRRIVAERERLLPLLAQVPYLEPIASRANFVLCRVTAGSAYDLKQALAQEGVLVRHYRKPLLRDYVRISVGTPEQTGVLLEALHALDVGQ
jgi:histidinol-phosphate aminotransferase